jgi:hydroxymethylpyrimidine/phosphomethylpyrimidine kinase
MAVSLTPYVLVVAGSDSSGGAGIARDIETVAAFGLRAALAVTAITVQTHSEVRGTEAVAASLVADQMRAAIVANPVAAIKIGMLATAGIVEAVADVLAENPAIPVVLDPVLASTSGKSLLTDMGIERLKARLLPAATLVTPNLPELALLTREPPLREEDGIASQATTLLQVGCRNVLVKGGHAEGPHAVDALYGTGMPPRHFTSPRRKATLRGTGCLLSSAIAANLALGRNMEMSIAEAKAFIDRKFDPASGSDMRPGIRS